MVRRILRRAIAVGVLGSVPGSVAAQTMVPIEGPVNLTQVSPDIEKVKLECAIGGPGLILPPGSQQGYKGQEEMYVMGGRLVMTMRVVFPIPAELLQDPIGKELGYICGLTGYSKSLQRWSLFEETQSVPAFRLKPTPQVISGSVVW